MHFEPNSIFGLICAALAVAAYFKSSRNDALKSQVENFKTDLERMTKRIGELETKVVVLETERDQARAESIKHYTVRTEVTDENRDLHKKLDAANEKVISLQDDLLLLQKNSLSLAAR